MFIYSAISTAKKRVLCLGFAVAIAKEGILCFGFATDIAKSVLHLESAAI